MKLNLQEIQSYIGEKCGGKEFYFGCWSPDDQDFNLSQIPGNFQVEQGKNWFAIRNGADNCDGLIFPGVSEIDPEVIIFRGYISEAAIHSYSSAEQVKEYWMQPLLRRHNGIFSAVTISSTGDELSIITDIFGMSPIYVREIGNLVFFSSASALLGLKDDEPNMMSWFMRVTAGYIPARASLSEEIELATEASVTTYSRTGKTVRKWIDYNDFPKGEESVNAHALELSEQKLSQAMTRCQNVHYGEVLLPLSSGYDSRRLFAHLHKSDISFGTCTVQSLMQGGADVEAECASQIAHDYQLKHKEFEYPSPQQWHKQDIQRLFSMDGQCQDHTWSVPLFNYYKDQKCCFYDGTAGDVFGFNGWVFTGHLEKIMPSSTPAVLKKGLFPDPEKMQKKLRMWKAQQPAGANQSMLTFAIWQTRKSSIGWSQQQAMPGHVILHPYLDLDYIETMLRFALEDNVVNRPQKAILYKYWPKLAAYRGTREMPEKAKNVLDNRVENSQYSIKRIIRKAFSTKNNKHHFSYFYSFSARCMLFISQYIIVRKLPLWWLKPVAELVFWWNSRPTIIEQDNDIVE